jgi:16S rRNA A1518/A1519 N6-dimethyltransferase RsmA/KsgA/DIM1 with predicted DNA glycosylase/AP lyase activity
MDKEMLRALLQRAGIEPSRRAETLTVEEWLRLWRVLHEDVAS